MNEQTRHNEDFALLHLNIRSCSKNFNHFEAYLNSLKETYDVIVLTETWNDESRNNLFSLQGYSHVSLNRNKHGGGIRAYYRNELVVDIYDELTEIYETHESLFIRVSQPKQFSVVIGCIYRPPRCSLQNFNEYLNSVLFCNNKIIEGKTILVGDMNYNYLERNNVQVITDIVNTMNENGFQMEISKPMRCVNEKAETLLDHIYTNFNTISKSNVEDYLITDHLPITFSPAFQAEKVMVKKCFRRKEKYLLLHNYNTTDKIT
jgi:hypothetical protein